MRVCEDLRKLSDYSGSMKQRSEEKEEKLGQSTLNWYLVWKKDVDKALGVGGVSLSLSLPWGEPQVFQDEACTVISDTLSYQLGEAHWTSELGADKTMDFRKQQLLPWVNYAPARCRSVRFILIAAIICLCRETVFWFVNSIFLYFQFHQSLL